MTASPSAQLIQELAAFAGETADAAAKVTMDWFRRPVDIVNKEDGARFDPVTIADQNAEEAIRALIEARYPDHGIIGEEHGVKEARSPFTWVLDPVDGTRAFISGLPTWGTLIGLLYEGEPLIGVIDQPYLKERYLGTPGASFLNGKPIRTRPCANVKEATLSTTDAALFKGKDREAYDRLLAECRLVRYGLDCYAYAILSLGYMDIVAEAGLKIYDMAALIPVIRGAGGHASDWEGGNDWAGGRLLALGNPDLLAPVSGLLAR
ncbi:histidinol-phosphatase [Gimibacter soli]|uniref:Histidinol-phosphatase n=1 Tax=Gimibacter soli TaxID=3024400 RepID=A0AAF0BMV8_9PROT|nr:histidinol-phosphatase [Gimibacter soli]WCL55066.1 histidinol-phosphatase [Gimibacter soli]